MQLLSDAFTDAAWAPPQDGPLLASRGHFAACVDGTLYYRRGRDGLDGRLHREKETVDLWTDHEVAKNSLPDRVEAKALGVANGMLKKAPAAPNRLSLRASIATTGYRDRIRERFQARAVVS